MDNDPVRKFEKSIAKTFKKLARRRQFWAATLILVAAIGGAIAIVNNGSSRSYDPSSDKPVASLSSCVGITNQSDQFRCYGTYYADKTFKLGEKVALADVKAAYNTDGYVKSQCHQLTHIIGRTSYKKEGGLDKSYAQGDSFCWSGFYHGGIEQAISDIGAARVKTDAPDICETFAKKRKYSFDHFNCVHGLGHGMMAVDDYKLPEALESCDVLKSDWERSSCQGGVFMENVMVASRGNGTTAYFKDDQPLYPCTMVKHDYKEQCYLMQTSQILQRNGYDFKKTFEECAKADTGFTDTCYRSIGRDASGSTVSDVNRTVANCRLAPSYDALVGCVLGADRDFVSYFHSNQQALALCSAFGGDVTAICEQDVAQYYKAF